MEEMQSEGVIENVRRSSNENGEKEDAVSKIGW